MFTISILKVDSPSCLWGRVVQGPGEDAETTEHYNKLLAQMNLFYNDVTQDLCRLKPTSLQDGQVFVVFWSVMKSWCRAVVESVLMDSLSSHARCFLVDHGERILVPLSKIRVATLDFLQLPFWMKKFHLAGIKPTTLRVSVFEEKAELMPSSQWDSSATLYLHNLLKASTQTEAVLLEPESDSTSIKLYLSVTDVKICVNDELVAKKFAYYSRETTDGGGLDAGDRTPVMLSSDILTRTISALSNNPAVQAPEASVTPQRCHVTNAADRRTAPSPPQSQLLEPVTCEGDRRSEVTGEQTSSSSQSRNGSEAAATERFLRFLNPSSTYQPTPPDVDQRDELNDCLAEETTATSKQQELQAASMSSETELTSVHRSEPVILDQQASLHGSSLASGAKDVLLNSLVEDEADEQTRFMLSSTSSEESVESGAAEAEQTWRSKEDWACSRLLEWLNPQRLSPDPDKADNLVSSTDTRLSGIVVHSALPVEPCNGLEDAPLTDSLCWQLQRKQNHTLSPAERYSWPAVSRGCNTLIISHDSDRPLSYLAPLLTHILLNSIFSSLTSSSGPIAMVLCPGWERVQVVYDVLMESKASKTLHPVSVLLGIGKDEAKAVKISKNCLLLLTTPFSLVRLLSCHCFLFLRLYHLVLDEADRLFTLAPDQMETILNHFKKVTSSKDKASCPQQLVVTAQRWTSHMESLVASHMPYPCIVITVPKEAALYGNVQQVTTVTLESSKISALLGALDFSLDVRQKTVIVANSVQEVEDVFKAVSNKSAFCLKTHEDLTHQFDFVIQQWGKNIGRGTNVILVTTDECLTCLGIRDANCVIHYGFPASPKLFGRRLFCMAQNFRNLSERVCSQDQTESCSSASRSVLLISEKNTRHIVGVMHYLERTNTLLPAELLSFTQGIMAAREVQKTGPLCSYLKSFGFCRDSGVCPDRHRFNSQLDQSVLPASGLIEVIPLYIKTASVFYGRLIRKEDRRFDLMASEMASYYADKKAGAKEVLEGGLYAVEEDGVFHRVKMISLPDNSGSPFCSVLVRFIDVGKEVAVKSHQILQLPDQFHSLSGQATEIIVCRVKPVDAETDWHPKVTRTISQKIRGLQHRARAVLSLGNTVFIDPMMRVTQVPGTKTLINEYNVQSEILNTGMGVSNPEHLDLLRDLCQGGLVNKDADHSWKLGDEPPSLEVRIKAEEAALAETFKAAAAINPPHVQPCEPFTSTVSADQSQVQAPAPEVHLVSVCDPKLQLDGQADVGRADTKSEQMESFHPQVQWYQTSDSVMVTVKLMNPEGQRCDFYPDRVVYSGGVSGRSYRADLELYRDIAVDSCCWEMKSNEPVLRLVKQQQGNWDRLVRNKNIFVSYNMEHFDEEEDGAPNSLLFEGHTGEDFCSDSDSSSDSD